MAEVRQEWESQFAPSLNTGATSAAGLLDTFGKLPDTAQSSVVGIGGVTLGISTLATGLTALRPLLAATFLPPGGLIVAGAVAAASLGVALYNASRYGEPLADTLARLEAESADLKIGMQTAAEGIETLRKATDKEGLKGAVEDLSGMLTGDAPSAFVTLADQAIASGADIDTVTQKILAGFLNAQIELVKLKRDANLEKLAQSQRRVIELEGVRGDTTRSNLEADIKAQQEYIAVLEEEAAQGDVTAQQALASNRTQLALAENRLRIIKSTSGETTNALSREQAEITGFNNVIAEQNKAVQELQASKKNPSGFVAEQEDTATVVPTHLECEIGVLSKPVTVELTGMGLSAVVSYRRNGVWHLKVLTVPAAVIYPRLMCPAEPI